MTDRTNEAAPDAVPEPTDLEAALVARDEQIAELNDRVLRALAEAENTRRQKDREVDEARRYAVTRFARDLLEVGDNLRRAIQSVPAGTADPAAANLIAGVQMTEQALQSVFERHQIKRIEPQVGEKLDPHRHQAMFEVPRSDLPPGSIAEVVQSGYLIADRLLRPALVGVVARAAEPGAGGSEPGARVDTQA